MSAPIDVVDLLNAQPATAVVANLFTFSLLSGPVLTYTDWRRPIRVAGTVYSPTPRLVRGTVRVERGTNVSTQQVKIQEANSTVITMLAQGFFNRALYRMDRIFAADATLQWTQPMNRFCGRVNSIDGITRSEAQLTIKCMLDDLDNDYPRQVLAADCNAVLFDQTCGLSRASYIVSSAAAAGCTKVKLLSGLSNPDVYFTQGVVTFTSGPMSGISYMVKSYTGGVIVPSYPFLTAPAAGTTFTVTPGCDKTLATCQSKYGYNPSAGHAPFFRGMPFVPDPTVTY
jgi:uncharacterized phage protein (TIGR02218 family)